MSGGELKTVFVVGQRPFHASQGYRVFNAPRPIYGDVEWTGPSITGTFYTVVDPSGPRAADYIRRNIELDARELSYLTPEVWAGWVDNYLAMLVKGTASTPPTTTARTPNGPARTGTARTVSTSSCRGERWAHGGLRWHLAWKSHGRWTCPHASWNSPAGS